MFRYLLLVSLVCCFLGCGSEGNQVIDTTNRPKPAEQTLEDFNASMEAASKEESPR